MKRILPATITLFACLLGASADAATLVADYQFKNPGNVVQDSSVHGFNGTNNGGIQGTTAFGGGFIAVSGGTYAITPALSVIGTGPLGTTDTSVSVSAWFNATVGGGNGQVVVEQGSTTPSNGWYDSQIELETNKTVSTGVWPYTSGMPVANSSPTTVNQGTWHEATFTYDNSSHTFSEYLDGNLVATAAQTRQAPWNTGGVPQFYTFGGPTGTTLGGNGNSFTGMIGETTIYNGALTPLQVENMFLATQHEYTGTPEPGSLLLIGFGAAGLCIAVRRRRNKA
jgi:hypothetical protein